MWAKTKASSRGQYTTGLCDLHRAGLGIVSLGHD